MNFEDVAKWTSHGSGSKQIKGYTGYVAPENYITIKNNTDAEFIKEGESSIVFSPQSCWYDYKLVGLKPNTKYALSFSYATNKMMSSNNVTQNTILSKYGVFNFAAEDANLNGVVNTPDWKASGYLHYIDTKLFTVMDDDGVGVPAYKEYSVRRITDGGKNGIAEVAGTWYNTVLYFNSGNVSETLAFVFMGNCANTYLDNFELIEIKDDTTVQEYFAPALGGKTATGTYNTAKATTTLYENVTETDFNGYKTTLESANFVEYTTNAYGDNKFATYVNGNTTVNVEYTPATGTILISEQVTDTLPTSAEKNLYEDKGLQPIVIQLDHNNATGGGIGMCYIIRLADGSFIIVDGGHTETYFDNANRLYNVLRQYTPEGDIQIAAWLFTHCHSDHISGFSSFIERYGAQVNLEQVVYNFATYEQNIAGKNDSLAGYQGFDFFDICLKLNPNVKISTCHSGYKYHIRNAVIDVMYTLEDNFPKVLGTNLNDANNTSTTFKISFADKNVNQTILIMGDSANEQCTGLLKKYSGTELKSTFVQAIHHGIYYGSYALYGKVNPEVVLFPASAGRLMNVLYQNQNSYFVKEDSVKEVICSDYGTRVFVLPYTAPTGLTGMSKFTLPKDFNVNDPTNSNTYIGASIRPAGEKNGVKQALRFKFQIPEHIINARTEDGYAVAEYGMLISESKANLNYYEGNKSFVTGADGKQVFKGVAYNKADGKKIVYDFVNFRNATEDHLRSTQYTCALSNIGLNEFGKTDYSKYDTTYYVRSYITFKKANGDIKVCYGEVKSASVFAVMKEILESDNADDVTYVKNFLDGKVDGFIADAAAIKDAWVKDSARALLYTPAN
jgi:beta-lactamase superfamily II metal-dependent hydrolase